MGVNSASRPPTQPGGDPTRPPGAVQDQTGGPATGSQPPQRHGEPTARTRTSSAYAAVTVGIIVLVLLIIFIVQNLEDASFHYLGAHFQLPVGLLMLISGVAGGLIVLLVSLARVFQLRRRARRARQEKLEHHA